MDHVTSHPTDGHASGSMWVNTQYWTGLIRNVGTFNLGDPLPDLDKQFVSVWARHYANIAELHQPLGSVLEIGAGYGVLAAGLGQLQGASVIATEHPSRTYMSRKGYRSFLNNNNVNLIAQDLKEGLPFKNTAFDCVYACDVIEHLLPEDTNRFLSEITRVLKSGGNFILSTPNLYRLANRIRSILGHGIQPQGQISHAGDTLGHVREYTFAQITRLLHRKGLITLRHTFGLIPYFTYEAAGNDHTFKPFAASWINLFTKWLKPLIPAIGDEVYLLYRKP